MYDFPIYLWHETNMDVALEVAEESGEVDPDPVVPERLDGFEFEEDE